MLTCTAADEPTVYATSIPACSSYNTTDLGASNLIATCEHLTHRCILPTGDKIGTWWLQVNFTDVAGLPEDAAANVSLTLVARACRSHTSLVQALD